jgi:hypothetical protein
MLLPRRSRSRRSGARQVPAGPGINRAVRPLRGIGRRRDVGAGAEAGIDQAADIERIERAAVIGEMLGLPPHVPVPVEAEPAQVREDRRLELAPTAADVDVLDAQQEAPARLARPRPGDTRRIGVAEMQLAGRAGGKTRDDGH